MEKVIGFFEGIVIKSYHCQKKSTRPVGIGLHDSGGGLFLIDNT